MSLFQPSVLKKYLADLDTAKVRVAYEQFRAHFADPIKQENIRNAKEEQYQEGFLRELFVDTLGYTLHPAPGYNLTTEFKNLTDAKKADGAILLHDAAIAVIELKGTNTTDFKKIEEQAFRYKNNHKGCRYVVTSNFERLRFYVDDATEFEEFDLFNLDSEAFALLYLCLAKTHVLAHLPADIKARSVTQEEQITRKLYADYSDFKRKLFTDLSARNPQHDRLLLFKKTQKLLDRLLFIFFAEDRGLLPPNSIHDILIQWQELRDKYDEPVSLYSRFQKYFGYMNTGHKGQKHEVFGYNGGLFAPDEVLDSVTIDDTVLFNGAWALTRYDFVTEVDVNILGHIFEHSLNEIEEIQAEIEGRAVDKGKTKRKKDGVFYTPKYITRYIVENTVGALCRQKQAELGLREEDYADRAAAKKKRKELSERLNAYQTWLEGITILDPACGSGAFLNQAFNFLSEEHARLDRLRATLFGDALVLRDTDLGILEHNLFGVDLNEESVEIAQLSLWLRTAKKGRKLSALSQHIRVGNSLISDPAVAGDKAFDWQAAFPQVFAKGGFDVVVGNPPYGADVPLMVEEYFKRFYEVGKKTTDTYALFFERSIGLLKNSGVLGFITPETMLRKSDFEALRNYLFAHRKVISLTETGPVFSDAPDTWCLITIIGNKTPDEKHKIHHQQLSRFTVSIAERLIDFSNSNWAVDDFVLQTTWKNKKTKAVGYLTSENAQRVMEKMSYYPTLGFLEKYFSISRGEEGSKDSFAENSSGDYWMLIPEDVYRNFCTEGKKVSSSGLTIGKLNQYYSKPKIWVIRIQKLRWKQRIVSAFDKRTNSASMKTLQVVVSKSNHTDDLKILQALLASKLINFWCVNFLTDDMNSAYLASIPIPYEGFSSSKDLLSIASNLFEKSAALHTLTTRFLRLLTSKHPALTLTKKLEDWPSLSFGDFLKEVKKQKIAWSLKEEAEWMDYFAQEQSAAAALRADIERTDRAIDEMVYALYGLTPEEVEVVEGR